MAPGTVLPVKNQQLSHDKLKNLLCFVPHDHGRCEAPVRPLSRKQHTGSFSQQNAWHTSLGAKAAVIC